jgi:site-specific DNA-methyltransferase (adenine-specific)
MGLEGSKMIELMHGDCLEKMKEIPDGSVDLTVTSPPYDNLRSYNGNNKMWGEDVWKAVLSDLYRVTKDGGVVVWVVADATIKGSETGTSFKQALYFKEMGFNIHDTMIYAKNNVVPLTHNRYEQSFEYMFILSKGRPKTFNPIEDKPNKRAGEIVHGTQYHGDKTKKKTNSGKKIIRKFGRRHNIFYYNNPGDRRRKHPAVFPEQLASDHITSWSNGGDIVLDPFMGSGTTGVACVNLSRSFIGIELDDEYFGIAEQRISDAAEGLD